MRRVTRWCASGFFLVLAAALYITLALLGWTEEDFDEEVPRGL